MSWLERLLSKALSPGAAKRVVETLNEALIVALAAQITTLLIIVYHFGQLSLVTLLSNFVVLPAQPGNTFQEMENQIAWKKRVLQWSPLFGY